ncbi:MAG: NAD-dependent epimerase/dehydratase family protein [Gemmatimonadota bacterium]|nr:MAG: NAD-dependent epimerase/dehydratase family protein [Gemmatimonadota bacterium]
MNILVTGGAGFIGSHVVDAYLDQGYRVSVLDDLSHGKREHLPSQVPLYVVDMCRPEVEDVFAQVRPDVLNHHAAQIDVRKSVADPVDDARVNILGSLNLFQLCVKFGVHKVIFASTGGAIYGEQDSFPATEDHPKRPISPYGVAKLSVETYLHFFRVVHDLSSVCLRYANVYGPRQDPLGEAGVVAIFSRRFLQNEGPIINGDGTQTRDYVYVEDVAQANLLALKQETSDIFNIGTGTETDVNTICNMLWKLTGADTEPTHGPACPGEQLRSVIDAAKAERSLGWRSKISLEEGLRRTVHFFRNLHEKS